MVGKPPRRVISKALGRPPLAKAARTPKRISTAPADTSMQPTLLLVDDEKHTRDGLRLALEDNHDIFVAADRQARP